MEADGSCEPDSMVGAEGSNAHFTVEADCSADVISVEADASEDAD